MPEKIELPFKVTKVTQTETNDEVEIEPDRSEGRELKGVEAFSGGNLRFRVGPDSDFKPGQELTLPVE